MRREIPEINERMHFGGMAGSVSRGKTGGPSSISTVRKMLKHSLIEEDAHDADAPDAYGATKLRGGGKVKVYRRRKRTKT